MSDSAALVERMSTAVRTAYKAIEVLKEENKALKAENDALKLEISKLRSGLSPDGHHTDITEGSANRPEPLKVHVSDPLGQSFQLKAPPRKDVAQPVINQNKSKPQPALLLTTPTAVPLRPTTTDVTIYARTGSVDAEEYGLLKAQCSLKFVNSPDSKRIFAVLTELSEFNVHTLARAISEISMETVSKALMSTVTSYFSMEVLTSWGNLLRSESLLSSSGFLLPKALLVRLDLLCTLLVSICSRTTNGLIRVSKLVMIVKKVILGSIRCQLESPHHALAVGTLRSRRVCASQPMMQHQDEEGVGKTGSDSINPEEDAIKTEEGNVQRVPGESDGEGEGEDADDSGDEDSRGHFGVPDEALSDSDSDSEGEDNAEEHKPVARPSLAAWGQARRESEADAGAASAGGAVVPQSEQKAALSSMFGLDSSDEEDEEEDENGGMTNDNDVSFINDNDMEVVNDNDFVPEEQSTAVAKSVATVVAALYDAPHSAKGSDSLEHASKLYVLLSALVRLVSVFALV